MADFSVYGGPSDEWLAVEASLPPPAPMDLDQRKRETNEGREATARNEMKDLAPLVDIKDYSIPTRDGSIIEGRSYRPVDAKAKKLPVYIHFHGGGFLFGTLASEDAICSRIAIGSGVAVLNFNYRHTPEYKYPTAWHDTQDAFEWTHSHIEELGGDRDKVVVGGISAGAQLTASLVLQKHLGRFAKSLPAIAGQVLMIPCVVNMDCYGPTLAQLKSESVSSYKENENAPIIPMKIVKMFTELIGAEKPKNDDIVLNPGNATSEQVKGLPNTVFGIAGLDPLRDEGLLYAKLLTEAGYVSPLTACFDGKADKHLQRGHRYQLVPRCSTWLQTFRRQTISFEAVG